MRSDARTRAQGRRLPSISITGVVCLAALMTACQAQPPGANLPESVAIDTTTTSITTSTTTTAVPPTDAAVAADEAPAPPPAASRYVVPSSEVTPDAKQLAVDIVHDLANYEANTNHAGRLLVYRTEEGPPIDDVASPLTHPGYWSRGEVVYPQLGGLTADRVSVMVVIRQAIGRGDEPEQTGVLTIDVRLVDDGNGRRFERLATAGGAFETIEHLNRARELAPDRRARQGCARDDRAREPAARGAHRSTNRDARLRHARHPCRARVPRPPRRHVPTRRRHALRRHRPGNRAPAQRVRARPSEPPHGGPRRRHPSHRGHPRDRRPRGRIAHHGDHALDVGPPRRETGRRAVGSRRQELVTLFHQHGAPGSRSPGCQRLIRGEGWRSSGPPPRRPSRGPSSCRRAGRHPIRVRTPARDHPHRRTSRRRRTRSGRREDSTARSARVALR